MESTSSYSASKSVSKWVHYGGLMLILGLDSSTTLCNMLHLMRCNKSANPPKAFPLWQKHKTFRRAWRPLVWVGGKAGISLWIFISLWETRWTWLIVRDVSPGSPLRVQEVSLQEVVKDSNVDKKSLTVYRLRIKHLVSIRPPLQRVHTVGIESDVGFSSLKTQWAIAQQSHSAEW